MNKFGLVLVVGLLTSCTHYSVAPPFADQFESTPQVSRKAPLRLNLVLGDRLKNHERSAELQSVLDTKMKEGLESRGWSVASNADSILEITVENYAIANSGTFCTAWMKVGVTFEHQGRKEAAQIEKEKMWLLCIFGGFERNTKRVFEGVVSDLDGKLGSWTQAIGESK